MEFDQKRLIGEVGKLEDKIDLLGEQITILRIEVAGLKIKSGFWGVIGGVSSALLLIAIEVIFKK